MPKVKVLENLYYRSNRYDKRQAAAPAEFVAMAIRPPLRVRRLVELLILGMRDARNKQTNKAKKVTHRMNQNFEA